VATASGVDILLHRSRQINGREIGNPEGLLLHHLNNIGLLQNRALDRWTVPALIPCVVLDVENGFRFGGGHDGLQLGCGGALKAILSGFRDGMLVFRVRARSRYLPWLFNVATESLEESGSGGRRGFRHLWMDAEIVGRERCWLERPECGG
ncbi:unnamed protein product, partial [Linum tenue]